MKSILVTGGAGFIGSHTCLLLLEKGFEVFVSDKGIITDANKAVLLNNEIEWEEQKHSLEYILNADEVIKSPGIPDGVDLKDASFATIASIAINGFRCANPELGHSVVVIGLGLIGLLTVQVAKAAGCKVIGKPISPISAGILSPIRFHFFLLTNVAKFFLTSG